MKVKVQIIVEFDTLDYSGIEHSPKGAEDLVKTMIDGNADWPEAVYVVEVTE